jgi:hypothetical protein
MGRVKPPGARTTQRRNVILALEVVRGVVPRRSLSPSLHAILQTLHSPSIRLLVDYPSAGSVSVSPRNGKTRNSQICLPRSL